MNIVMSKLFGERNDVVIVDPGVIGSIDNEDSPVNTRAFATIFAGKTNEKILIPICCSNTHWCCVMVNLNLNDVCIYDPMSSSYVVRVRAIAEKLAMQLPNYAPRKYRVHHYMGDLGVQVDSYNCGMYVLLAFEVFVGAQGLCMLSRKELQYLRYRYIYMCL